MLIITLVHSMAVLTNRTLTFFVFVFLKFQLTINQYYTWSFPLPFDSISALGTNKKRYRYCTHTETDNGTYEENKK